MRAIGVVTDGAFDCRRSTDSTPPIAFPSSPHSPPALEPHEAVLDGEIVTFDEDGRPSFGLLQPRMQARNAVAIRERAASQPVFYVLFDLIELDGEDLTDRPYEERRAALLDLVGTRPTLEGERGLGRRRGRPARGDARRKAWRGSSPSASAAVTSSGGAVGAGSSSKCDGARSSSSAGGCPARDLARHISARCWSAITTRRSKGRHFGMPGASAPVSTRPSWPVCSRAVARPRRRRVPLRSRTPACGRAPGALGPARVGGRSRVRRMDQGRDPSPPGVRRPACRQVGERRRA